MKHRASPRFWSCYHRLPKEIQTLADRSYEQLRRDESYRSLHLKKVGPLWSVRVGLHYRALAVEEGTDLVWVWIGPHAEYDQIIRHR
jgi:hypothetical protein